LPASTTRPTGRGAALVAFFAVVAESERDYIRDETLEVQDTARAKGKAIGGVEGSDEDMLATVPRPRLRDDGHLSLREIVSGLVIRTGRKRGRRPAPAAVMRMVRERDGQSAAARWNRSGDRVSSRSCRRDPAIPFGRVSGGPALYAGAGLRRGQCAARTAETSPPAPSSCCDGVSIGRP
jgi:hypothetical protein